MASPGSYEVLTFSHGRPYMQFGGPRPSNAVLYYGGETNYVAITGVSNPVLGGIDRINVHDQNQVGAYAVAGTSISPPDLPTGSLMIREKQGAIPRQLTAQNCYINSYLMHGKCKSLADFDNGWEDYVEVFSNGRVMDRNLGDRFTFDSDDPLETELAMSWTGGVYPVGSLTFAEKNATAITLEVLDITYSSRLICGECGPTDDGTKWIYVVEKGGAAAKPIVHYSNDGGATWSTSSIAVAANAEAPCAIRVMGGYLVAVSPTANTATNGGYYYAPLNLLTGAPGTWVKVTTGFTNNQEPRDMVVLGPREAYLCTDSGEILKITDVLSGATSLGIVTTADLTRIAASPSGDTIVAVGATATVMVSTNRGLSFAATTTAPGAATLNAISVLDANRFWVGNSSGAVYYTLNRGASAWSTQSLPITAAAVQDIVFATDEVGYISATIAGTLGRILGTINGGRSWVSSDAVTPRIVGVPTTVTQRYNRIAVPRVVDQSTNANNILIGGLGLTTDGALMLGAANVF